MRDTTAFVAHVTTRGNAFESGAPRRLPFPPTLDVTSRPQPSADGQRFLVEVTQDRREAGPSISVVLNWPALLKN